MPRTAPSLVPGRVWNRWFLFGGLGKRTGNQGQRDPDLGAFDGNWHALDDLWELDLENNRWRECFTVGRWLQPRVARMVHHPMLDCVVFLQLTAADSERSPMLGT